MDEDCWMKILETLSFHSFLLKNPFLVCNMFLKSLLKTLCCGYVKYLKIESQK